MPCFFSWQISLGTLQQRVGLWWRRADERRWSDMNGTDRVRHRRRPDGTERAPLSGRIAGSGGGHVRRRSRLPGRVERRAGAPCAAGRFGVTMVRSMWRADGRSCPWRGVKFGGKRFSRRVCAPADLGIRRCTMAETAARTAERRKE